jgi:tRNA U55 pseudouridine synthase TruB
MLHLNEIDPQIIKKQFEIFKPYGYTPKDVIDEILIKTRSKKATFNGRLDPMACGCMRVYLDDACQLSKFDTNLGKMYRFKMALGLSSSSCDLLGYPSYEPIAETCLQDVELKIVSFLTTLQNGYAQTLPSLSSFRVSNKEGITQPLWWWDKHNRLSEVSVPTFERKLFDFKMNSVSRVSLTDLSQTAIERISLINVKHTFNQAEILDEWRRLQKHTDEKLVVFDIQVSVSSGFYVRKLVEDIGSHLCIKTITVEIERLAYFSLSPTAT